MNNSSSPLAYYTVICVLVITACAVTMTLQHTTKKEPYVEIIQASKGTVYTSQFKEDNLNKRFNPEQSSCLEFVENKLGWRTLFDDDQAPDRLRAITGLQRAKMLVAGSAKDTLSPYVDVCVIPEVMAKEYNLNNDCMLRTAEKTTQLQKSTAAMDPPGCMVDLNANNSNGRGINEMQFKELLLDLSKGMNYGDEMRMAKLRKDIVEKEETVGLRDGQINDRNTTIDMKGKDFDNTVEEHKRTTGLIHSFAYVNSLRRWVQPVSDYEIGTFGETRIKSASNMTITFWIYLHRLVPYHRNILHVTNKVAYGQYQRRDNATELSYRRPAIYLLGNTNHMHITRDTKSKPDQSYNLSIPHGQIAMVGLVWNGRTLTMYVDNNRVESYVYSDDPLPPDQDSKVFFSNRFTYNRDIYIRDLKFYDTALSRDMFLRHYNTEIKY